MAKEKSIELNNAQTVKVYCFGQAIRNASQTPFTTEIGVQIPHACNNFRVKCVDPALF